MNLLNFALFLLSTNNGTLHIVKTFERPFKIRPKGNAKFQAQHPAKIIWTIVKNGRNSLNITLNYSNKKLLVKLVQTPSTNDYHIIPEGDTH